ncbi:MAG: hypothetical protein U0936_10250 [Planctomycetaceae bacterium]
MSPIRGGQLKQAMRAKSSLGSPKATLILTGGNLLSPQTETRLSPAKNTMLVVDQKVRRTLSILGYPATLMYAANGT